tara:strand:- start:805 stop:1023 length:219 start_codon:yes stop_codon:yes gene_type:complete
MQRRKFKTLLVFVLLTSFGITMSACGGRKAKSCPAFSEAQYTGGTIDKNKKRRKRKVKQGVFDKKTSRRYRR